MRWRPWGGAVVLLVVNPAIGWVEPQFQTPVAPSQFAPAIGPGAGPLASRSAQNPYSAPRADGPVAVLLDEGIEPLFPILNNISGETGTITREDRDVFAGVESARVAPLQRYSPNIPGWNFRIVETPKAAGEFRYLRFAWKKVGGTGIMVQFHEPARTWGFRFHAGRNVNNWQPSKPIAEKIPTGWELATLDLFKEYGAFTITGFALTPLDGQAGLFDHMLLGRTIADLDKATDIALGRAKPKTPLSGKERDALWKDLLGQDGAKAGAALRAFLASALDQVSYIREKLATSAPDRDLSKRIEGLAAGLDDDSFDVRDKATDTLIAIGAPAVDRLRALIATNGTSDEVLYRARLILRKLGPDAGVLTPAGKMARLIRILERAGGRDARDLLKAIAAGAYGMDGAEDAKSALARMPDIWKR